MAYRNFYESSFWKNQQKTQSLSEGYEAGYSNGIKMLSQGAGTRDPSEKLLETSVILDLCQDCNSGLFSTLITLLVR